MRRTSASLLWLAPLLALACAPAEGALRFKVELSEVANLTYQLDCVGGLIPCGDQDFKAFWEKDLLKTPKDRARLAAWVALRERYERNVELEAEGETPPLAGGTPTLDLGQKIRIAGLQARSLDDYASRLEILVLPTDRAAFLRAVQGFLPAFEVWWKGEAVERGRPFVSGIEDLLNDPKVARPFARIVRFYAPALEEGSTIHIALVARPARAGGNTSGQQIEATSVVEFLPDEKPENRIDVVLHELCHFLFGSPDPAAWVALQKRFLATGAPEAIPAYNLLNEGLASALGNGQIARAVLGDEKFARLLAKEGSFYSNPSVDRAGKALLPLLDEWLAAGRTLFDPEFVPRYLAALKTAFGPSLTAPRLYLAEMALVVDESLGENLRRSVRRPLRVASMYASTGELSDPQTLAEFRKYPSLNALFLVHPSHLGELAQEKVLPEAETKRIAERVARDGAAIYAFERAPNVYGFVLAGGDETRVQALVETLAKMEESFLGFATP